MRCIAHCLSLSSLKQSRAFVVRLHEYFSAYYIIGYFLHYRIYAREWMLTVTAGILPVMGLQMAITESGELRGAP
jgi:hypothetical protein